MIAHPNPSPRAVLHAWTPRFSKGLVLLLAVSGCAMFPTEEEPAAGSVRRATLERHADLEAETDSAEETPTPQPELDEETLPDTATLTTPVPTATVPSDPDSTNSPLAASPAPPAAAGTLSDESVLPLIGPATAPQTAAALRLIENGRMLLAQNQTGRAQEDFERAVAIDPANPYGYYFIARTHYAAQNYGQADSFASRAVTLSARADSLWQARIALLQGLILEAAGRYPEARQAYQRAMRADPQNTQAQLGFRRLTQ